MGINNFLGLLVSQVGGIMLLENVGNYYHMTQSNIPEDLNHHQHHCENFICCMQVDMYILGCIPASTEGILLKILIWSSTHICYKQCKFGCN